MFHEGSSRFLKSWSGLMSAALAAAILAGAPAWWSESESLIHAQPVGAGQSKRPVDIEQVGQGGQAAWIFTPNDPRPATAPVILFLHGYRATDPYEYGAWIDHLVRRGNVVIYPVYEDEYGESDARIFSNLVQGVTSALDRLRTRGPVSPDLQRLAIVGHSFGGGLSAVFAARVQEAGLPAPKAIMPVQPGWRDNGRFPSEYLDRIPGAAMLLVVEGDRDQFSDSRHGKTIIDGAGRIPDSRKQYVRLQSGQSGVVADHYAPLAPDEAYRLEEKTRREERRERIVSRLLNIRDGETDELDRDGLWKLFDALLESAFRTGSSLDEAVRSVRSQNMQLIGPPN